MNRKNYDLVDLTKFIQAILVISIHAGVPGASWIGRIAVPYFFIVSGYFYFKKYNQLLSNTERLKSYFGYSKRILGLLMIWNLMYLPLIVYNIISKGNFSIVETGFLFLIGRLPGLGVSWYLCASIVGLGTLLLMMHLFGNMVTFVITIIIEVGLILFSGYHSVLSNISYVFDDEILNNIMYSFIRSWLYLFLGFCLSKHLDRISFVSKKCISVVLAVYLIEHFYLNVFDVWTGGVGTDETLFVPLLSFCIAVYTLKSKLTISSTLLLRRLSTFIYLAHSGVLTLHESLIGGNFILNINVVKWIITFIVVCAIYYILSRRSALIKLVV
ncbi:acyltransferase family protein [Weissella cibaria]|uniref:acyltransferase family protein n=1 Tax=Weissella cibaria TaxID=137591 RepID=UPI0013DB95FD|nr:acyltransferase family protein [Weissella cibaria]NFA02539.1 hypothetical protein [Weissella cibaria]